MSSVAEWTTGVAVGGRFQLDAVLASGASATVWRGLDLATGLPVALKLYHQDLISDPQVSARFRQEAEVLRQLREPHIARLIHADVRKTRQPYLVIEHVPGISLREELALRSEAGRPPTPMMVVALFGQLTTALSAAHDRGIVHRDLKPANIMFSAKGKEVVVKLLDFGVAKVTETSQPMTTKGRLIGSYAYMAPEQVDARSPVGPASDVFALGTLIYEVAGLHRAWLRDDDDQPLPFHSPAGLSSRNAPPALVRRILQGELPARRPEVDLVWDLLEAAWSGEPSQRPSVAEMRRELRTRLGDDDADDEAAELTRAAHLVALERRRGSTLANPALAARVPSADEPWALEETFGASAEATPFGASPDSARRRAWASRLLWGALIGGGVFLLGLVAGGLFS